MMLQPAPSPGMENWFRAWGYIRLEWGYWADVDLKPDGIYVRLFFENPETYQYPIWAATLPYRQGEVVYDRYYAKIVFGVDEGRNSLYVRGEKKNTPPKEIWAEGS